MKKIPLKFTALSLSLLLSSIASAEELSAKQSLDKMTQALNNLNYEIAFVQTTPANMDSFRYRHIKQDNKTYAQLVTLDGHQQEIIQRDNLVSYFQPNAQAFTLNSSNIVDAMPAVVRANFDKLSSDYDFVKLGKDRVAGRFADTIRIVPKDDFRYQYLVFVDEENGLLLRGDMLDREGKLLDQFRVVTLYIDDRLRGLTDYINKVSLPPLLKESKNEQSSDITWSAGWLPQGFSLIRYTQEILENEIIDSALYSDGLFTFTLFVPNVSSNDLPENTWKQGAYTIYSEVIGGKEITFIGQLPISTAKRIVQEVKFR
ncbi:TPA: sigma-E factor regulatory protein RseB [Haemophilus influenzae]|uniref:sigma-E factor regulatory protein RseB n=1 Tax=Haemophilus influenzae TaxID=727 RepID=UPI0005AEF0FD|nr:sigma-E factor regulatory protein RseB [Haemophilus influenzae]KIP44607.1 sigma-E factor regulatory protein RseB [Haemophilus influenzae]MDO7271969.1 sigma-E factor regulatory protein RseB [Haemophilus influenzae]PRL08308.1 Sigma-E factor regulatory protein RseB precursor [Haemophilus influenzae]PRL10569.1 Sigma-E factor regulatory protein RseB precursor [Haemophilus influenzae]CWX09636.1 sigma-e factor regulatory protein rseb [Haemophilus influenzae]